MTVLVAVIYIPIKLGGFGHIFGAAAKALPHASPPGSLLLAPDAFSAYATLALGSALALFLYPHSITAVLASDNRNVIRRNAALLPAYTFLLGLIALLGFMAIAAHVSTSDPNFAVPNLFIRMFPSWFVGFAFAAIAIGALVPAAVMSIAAANLFTRNIYTQYFRRDATDQDEARVARIVSLVVKFGALAFVIFLPTQYAINLQLLGGVWILQTLPAVVLALYTRWFHRWALIAGWAVGMVLGTAMVMAESFETSVFPLKIGGFSFPGYAAVFALMANLALAAVLTPVFGAAGAGRGEDETVVEDYGEGPQALPQPELAGS